MQRVIWLALALASLISCSTPEQDRLAEQRRMWAEETERNRRAREQDAFIEALRAQCQKFGYQPGSDAMARCVQAEAQRVQDTSARATAVANCKQAMALRPASGGFGASMENVAKCDADPQAHLRPEDKGVNCFRNIDGSVSCTPRQ